MHLHSLLIGASPDLALPYGNTDCPSQRFNVILSTNAGIRSKNIVPIIKNYLNIDRLNNITVLIARMYLYVFCDRR